MSKSDDFFLEMEALFLPLDKEAFHELKEDLLEHIQIQLESGKSEDEILDSLGNPHEIVDEFYEDQRMHTALNAEKDVIPVVEIERVYKNERAIKIRNYIEHGIKILKNITIFLISILIVYFITYAVYEATRETHIAIAPIVITCLLFGILIPLLKKNKIQTIGKVFFWFGILGFSWITATNSWFYEGNFYNKTILMPNKNDFDIILHSDFPAHVVTVQVPSGQKARMEVKGYFKTSDIKHLEKQIKDNQENDDQEKDNQLKEKQDNDGHEQVNMFDINFGSRNIFDLFTKMEKAEVILYIPENQKVDNFNVTINDGNIKIVYLDANNLDISIKKGEFQVIDLNSNMATVQSKNAEIVINEFYSTFNIINKNGKTIIKSGEGNLNLESEKGYIDVEKLISNEANIINKQGKIDIRDTKVEEFYIKNNLGNIVMDTQNGNTKIQSQKGEVILRNLQKKLNIDSHSSRIVVTQIDEIEGEITSSSGVIKWIQSEDAPLNFIVENESGNTENAFAGMNNSNKKKVSIYSKSADVMIIRKHSNQN